MRGAAVLFAAALAVGTVAGPAAGIPTPTPATAHPPRTALEPWGGSSLFSSHRVVAFYGAPDSPSLGVLGDAPPAAIWPRLVTQADAYRQPAAAVIPAFELITYVAESAPRSHDSYAARIPDATIAAYLAVARAHHGLLILDIQPGRGDFLADAESLARWLAEPDVGLALDPEWQLGPQQLPMRQIGHTTATEVNEVSSWLGALVEADRLPQKLFLIHDFTPTMVEDKAAVHRVRDLATVFNMDGFGSRPDKVAAYRLLAADPRFGLGFKLFYGADTDIFGPSGVLALKPAPDVIEYE